MHEKEFFYKKNTHRWNKIRKSNKNKLAIVYNIIIIGFYNLQEKEFFYKKRSNIYTEQNKKW